MCRVFCCVTCCCVALQLRYEERIQDVETHNVRLQRDVSELTSSSHPHSSQLSIQRELDSVKERHRKQMFDLEQTIDGLRQQLLRLRAKELGIYVYVYYIHINVTDLFLHCYDSVR